MHTGIVQLGTIIPITMVTAAQIQSVLDAFVTVDASFNAARSAQCAADGVGSFQAAMGTLYDRLLGVSNMLATRFGTRCNTQWAQAGFTNNTTAIPTKIEDRLALALALVKFFAANPSYEVASMSLTAAQGTTLRTAALTAQQAVTTAAVALNTLGDNWQMAYDALVAVMRTLIKNLEGKLAKDDPRWLSFGLQMPGSISTPGKPVDLTAHLDETGALVLQCAALPLATRYRWRTMLVGVQTTYQLAASTTEPMASIADVAPGRMVHIIVQGVNGNLQGVASDPVTLSIPAAKASAPVLRSALEEVSPAARESNGHGNGNGNGHARHSRAA
ncbi:MAG: hypothetical protein WCF18_23740 [Chthoniobacteraceae bacterium]